MVSGLVGFDLSATRFVENIPTISDMYSIDRLISLCQSVHCSLHMTKKYSAKRTTHRPNSAVNDFAVLSCSTDSKPNAVTIIMAKVSTESR